MTLGLINANPIVREKKERIIRSDAHLHCDHHDAVDPLDIYDFVRDIRDPEHPYSLEQLSVLSEESITVDEKLGRILITFTPTIQHCSMATVIGLCLRVKLKDCFPPHFKVDIKVAPGSHADEEAVNKQLNDKERVVAAMENPNLRQLVDECLHSKRNQYTIEMDDLRSRSFSFRRSVSFNNRSNISSATTSRFMAYQKLSDDTSESSNNRRHGGGWAFLTQIFSFKKPADSSIQTTASSWRPDPNCRWPVQGW
ncbi:hypothetical protein OSB04_027243 [Centaurea solstitialis]|uniref:MIP18 family-like domain-containing protein n=1 Tax=Centaurea solstitialis TaxID=347529 RepID=A0AA38VZI8_9ASTR|nr:hypothetical protein OSB04_027243 [Centaurea solstitialis]